MATVEAKRKNIDVSGALQQAKRYSRGFASPETLLPEMSYGGTGAEAFRVPFAFSTNGRPFLRQLATKSGIWFCDLRRPDNLGSRSTAGTRPEG
jgi:type I restriction enzyme R subunit